MEGLLIGGETPHATETFKVKSPYTGEVVAEVARGTVEHVGLAVAAARFGAETMREIPAHRRSAMLMEIGRRLLNNQELLARTIAEESGKPIRDARAEVARAATIFQLSGEEAKRLRGEEVPFDSLAATEGRFGFFVREPLGIVGAITPFNVPLALAAHKIGPALAAGNAVIFKPAEQTPSIGLRLTEICWESGLPSHALSCVPGMGEEAGAAVVEHPDIRFLSFTGSRAVGLAIPSRAGPKRVSLELGNNGATVITPSAHLEEAAAAVVKGGYTLAGQLCISIQRLYLHESIAARFLDLLIPQIHALVVGDPFDDATDVGPMIDPAATERVHDWVTEAIGGGAELLVGGRREGACYMPTLLANAPPAARIMCEEVFGPVIATTTYSDFEEVIERVNATPYGLQMSVFTQELGEAFRFARRVQAGGVIINDTPMVRSDMMPYGGNKESGIGREGVRWAIEAMTETKVVAFNRPWA